MKKLRVAVVRGGPSSEYAISLATGGAVLENLSKEKYDVQDIFISKDGEWNVWGIPYTPAEALQGVDVVFNALHGKYGENGGLANIAEQLRIPYTGSRALAGALALSKPKTRNTLERHRILMPRSHVVFRGGDLSQTAQTIFSTFTPPWVIKPVNEGSSVGVALAFSIPELIGALENLFQTREAALIEEYIRGEEVSVLTTQGKEGNLYVLPPVRIQRDGYVFTHLEKGKQKEHSTEIPFSEKVIDEAKHIAQKAHSLLGLRHYSRTDAIITPAGRLYLLEINAAPSLSAHTPTNHALTAANTNIPEFLDHLVTIARN